MIIKRGDNQPIQKVLTSEEDQNEWVEKHSDSDSELDSETTVKPKTDLKESN